MAALDAIMVNDAAQLQSSELTAPEIRDQIQLKLSEMGRFYLGALRLPDEYGIR